MGGGYLVQIYEDAAGESSAEPAAAPNGSDPTPPDDVGEDSEDDEDEDFDDVLMAAQQATAKRGQRTSVSAEVYGAWNQMDANFVPPFYERSPAHEDFFLQLLSTHPIFAALPAASIRLVIGAIFPHDSAQGEIVIQEGDDGDYLFFVESG